MADQPNPYESPQEACADDALLSESEDEAAISTRAAKEAYRALPWLMILMVVFGMVTATIFLPGLAVLVLGRNMEARGRSLLILLVSLLPAAFVFLAWRVRSAILVLKKDADVSSLTRLMRRSGELLSFVFVLLCIGTVIQVYVWIAALRAGA